MFLLTPLSFFAGSYTSFEYVELYDLIYRMTLGIVFFFGILQLLQPLTMNYHFFILQKSLLRARYDLCMSLILIILAIISFGSYLFLAVGKYVDQFKDLYSSIITLLRMLLAMISLRLNPNMDSTAARTMTGLFFFAISLIGINLFIAIMFGHFADVQAMQKTQAEDGESKKIDNDMAFDFELNQHVWKQLDSIIHVFSPKKVGTTNFIFNHFDEVAILSLLNIIISVPFSGPEIQPHF